VSLIEGLREVAASLDPSLQPSSNEVGPMLGALVAYTEHGPAVLKAAKEGPAALSELLSSESAPKSSSSPSKGER
jgi:hypothetical protein